MFGPHPSRRQPSFRVLDLSIGLLLCLAATGAVADWHWPGLSLGSDEETPDWGYRGNNGPAHWAALSPRYAACDGNRQSPIDLGRTQRLPYAPISFRYRSNPLSLRYDGHSVEADYRPGSYIMVDGRRYELERFRFHVPAEHHIRGRRADMELQLIHRDARGRYAIVAVLMVAGRKHNPMLARILDHLPPTQHSGYYNRRKGINPLFLLPNERSYLAYTGSLTQPPCTENVSWYVLPSIVEVEGKHVRRLRQLLGDNARPLQPTNDRSVYSVSRR